MRVDIDAFGCQAWVSEKAAPEILQYETDAVTTLLDLTKEQEELSREHATDTVNHQFLYNVYQVEVRSIHPLQNFIGQYFSSNLIQLC